MAGASVSSDPYLVPFLRSEQSHYPCARSEGRTDKSLLLQVLLGGREQAMPGCAERQEGSLEWDLDPSAASRSSSARARLLCVIPPLPLCTVGRSSSSRKALLPRHLNDYGTRGRRNAVWGDWDTGL